MADEFLVELLVQKLGHELEEIRLRALNSIHSKIKYGLIKEEDLLSNNDIFKQLLNWFKFEQCPEKEKVLKLILQLLKIVRRIGSPSPFENFTSKAELKNLQENLPSPLKCLVEQIISESKKFANRDKEEVETTQSPFDLVIEECPSVEQLDQPEIPIQVEGKGFYVQKQPLLAASAEALLNIIPHLLLPWQPLIATDRHVLAALEEALNNPPDEMLLLHSCRFFNDVMLQDFPPEVFLQRPGIVKSFLEILENYSAESNAEVYMSVIKCLSNLIEGLRTRVQYYCDPCTANLKQETCIVIDPFRSSASVGSNRTMDSEDYLPNSSSDMSNSRGMNSQHTIDSQRRGHTNTVSDQQSCFDKGAVGPSGEREEDSVIQQVQQLTIPNFCCLVLNQVLKQAEDVKLANYVISLLNECVTPEFWESNDPAGVNLVQGIRKAFWRLAELLTEYSRYTDDELRLMYIQYLTLTERMLRILVPVKFSDLLPTNLREQLVVILLDFPVMKFFPKLHENLRKYCKEYPPGKLSDDFNTYLDCELLYKSMVAAVKILKQEGNKGDISVIDFRDAVLSFEFHEDMSFIEKFLDFCTNCKKRQSLDKKLQKILIDAIVDLLAHSCPKIRREMYACCHKCVLRSMGVHFTPNRPSTQLSFLFDSKVLTEIVCHGISSEDEKISQCASEMIVHLIKGKLLMSSDIWEIFTDAMIPVLPLLQCYADKNSMLGKMVVGMLTPQAGQDVIISIDELLKGNVRLLFCPDDFVREEAVSNLIYILSKENASSEKIPDLATLHSTGLSHLCLVDLRFDSTHPTTTQGFYSEGSLYQVMKMAMGEAVHPRVRRSSLVQLSTMLTDHHLHDVFLNEGGLIPLLSIFFGCLHERDYVNYPYSMVPIINILKNICLRNSTLRLELSQNTALYCGILRGLFLFSSEDKFRTDAAQLLCLLAFNSFIFAATQISPADSTVSLPEIFVRRMRLPLKFKTHWRTSPNTQPSMKRLLMNNDLSKRFIQLCWTLEWFCDMENLSNLSRELEEIPFSAELLPSRKSMYCFLATDISNAMRERTYNIQNATSHESVQVALTNFIGYLQLILVLPSEDTQHPIMELHNLPWESTFQRFLNVAPTCSEDRELLLGIIQFFNFCTILWNERGEGELHINLWLSQMLQDSRHPLSTLLKMDLAEASINLCRELYLLCQLCSASFSYSPDNEACKTACSWSVPIEIIHQNLKSSDTQHFYNLAFLNWILNCLAQLTSETGWSQTNTSTLGSLLKCLMELLKAFYCSKGIEGSTSFMGLSVTKCCVTCINHILAELQTLEVKEGWEAIWMSAMDDRNVSWLSSLWLNRDPLIRAGGMQLAAGLCVSRKGCVTLLECLPGSSLIWETALTFLLDHGEASLVRQQAAVVLANLSIHIISSKKNSVSQTDVINGQIKQDVVSGVLEMLERGNFYEEACTLMTRLSLNTEILPGGYIVAPSEPQNSGLYRNWSSDKSSGLYLMVYGRQSSVTGSISGTEDEEPHLVTTPGLVKSVCRLILNLIMLNPEKAAQKINQCTLVRILMRSVTCVPKQANSLRSLMLYVDTLEMYSAICRLVYKSISTDITSRDVILHTYGSLSTLISLLNENIYRNDNKFLLTLRNELWKEIFYLLSVLSTCQEGYDSMVEQLSSKNAYHLFMTTLCESLKESIFLELADSGITCLTALLSQEQKLINPSNCNTHTFQSLADKDINMSVTRDVCNELLHLYDMANLQIKRKLGDGILHCLGSLLSVSNEATQLAKERGLLDTLLAGLSDFQSRLISEGADGLNHISGVKKLVPILHDIDCMLMLTANFLYGSDSLKLDAADKGLADIVHKLWNWICLQTQIQVSALQLLCTFTSNCAPACRSLVLTSTVQGVGLRKNPSTMSMLHVMVAHICQDLKMPGKPKNMSVLSLVLHLLKNSCQSQECRVVLVKSNLLQADIFLLPLLNKRRHFTDLRQQWMTFLLDLSFYQEGQLAIPKVKDALNTLINLSENQEKSSVQNVALCILQNISFSQSNRPCLLVSMKFLHLLSTKLVNGNAEEKFAVVVIIWALAANNQKAKLTLRVAGITSKLQETVKKMHVLRNIQAYDENSLETFTRVLKLLSASDNKSTP